MTIKLNVEGMTCSHCEATVKKAVSAIKGVKKVTVDLAGKSVTVDYDEKKTNESAIRAAIADAGYDVL